MTALEVGQVDVFFCHVLAPFMACQSKDVWDIQKYLLGVFPGNRFPPLSVLGLLDGLVCAGIMAVNRGNIDRYSCTGLLDLVLEDYPCPDEVHFWWCPIGILKKPGFI